MKPTEKEEQIVNLRKFEDSIVGCNDKELELYHLLVIYECINSNSGW